MALPSSGQISISDILNEGGVSSSQANASLNDLESGNIFTINTGSSSYPLGSTPNSISEWYSYDHNSSSYTNTHYYTMTKDALRSGATSSPFNLSGTQDLSISLWINQQATTANEVIWDFANTTANTANRFFLQYNYGFNRLIVRHRTNSTNYDRQFALHDNNSVTGTGTSSGTKWSDSNRGNVNSDGWSMLTVTYDASQSNSSNGIKLYWNATELTTQAVNNSGSRSTSAVNAFTIGNNNHNSTTTAGGLNANIDEVKIFTNVLSSSNVTSLYNSGVVANAANSYSTGLLTEYSFDSDTTDSANVFNITHIDTGARTSY